ncbi:beta-glucuronidase [Devosia pacifica]|uniref:Beta-glucuronidase n=1 Tax=Devosia pacifica TaxID=1335967 RepID=A0A918RYQ3_9HYPH|nr:sugar-binding domain-containing protein [Devosia pacifica]GHA16267.1 beta-glucuronidase [Devosia pacifica]
MSLLNAEVDQLHPNPQKTRSGWTDLCGTWQFAHDDANAGLDERWFSSADAFDREIIVPFPPESKASGLRETGFHPYVWYRRSFEAPAHKAGERVMLHFGAVDYAADVWVNGQHVASHTGGHTPFSADITNSLGEGEQVVVVRAEDQPQDVRFPRGKQDWQENPHAIWYYRTTGIWQPVWLEIVPDVHLTDLHFTPDIDNSGIICQVRLNKAPRDAGNLSITLTHNGAELAATRVRVADSQLEFTIALGTLAHVQARNGMLWSPEQPNLVEASAVLECDGGEDRIESYVGLRTVSAGTESFLLNERPYFLRMALGQNYWPDSHLAATGEELKREVELIKAMGFNGVRIHQKIEDPRFLYWCDRLGIIVWEEMPSAYAFTNSAVEALTREWLDVIRRDKSHPCIVTWVPFNESWGIDQIATREDQQHYASALYHLTKAIDPSRPVISNDGWELVESDIWSIHDYSPDGEGLAERFHTPEAIEAVLRGMGPARRRIILGDRPHEGQPVMITEFGGLSYAPKAGENWHGYATVETAEEYEDLLRDMFDAIAESRYLSGFCYTQVTDTEQETNGLLTERREPKLPLEVIREIVAQPSYSIPSELVDQARKLARESKKAN